MHILEMVIFTLSILLMGIMITKKTIKIQYIVAFLIVTVFLFLLYLILYNIRWQLYPLYLSVFILVTMVVFKTIKSLNLTNFIRRSLIVVLTLFILVSLVSTIVFPVFELNKPSGDYLIGTESFVIEDQNRLELYSENTSDFRRFKIQVWYPAESVDGFEQAPWLEEGQVISRALSKDMGLPSFVLDHTVDIMSNSYFQAPISNALNDYPVIILSHGWRGFRALHTDLAEELASQGYIVVGIDHTYGSVATVFSNNDIAYLNSDALPERETTPNFIDYANQLVNTYAFDITTTLDYLEEINNSNNPSRFSGKLDLTTIGLLGHSTGGGADVVVALNDDRIDALIGMDAWVEPIDELEIDKGLSIPSLFLRSGAWETGFNNANLYALIENSTYPSELYQIDGTTHYDFAMVDRFSPLTKLIGYTGDVKGDYMNSILISMMTDFFNSTLRNDSNSEINADIWAEVRIITPE